ncbi:hypothetical protein AAE478_008500 [Parahypoxylon ruwenzoriense]
MKFLAAAFIMALASAIGSASAAAAAYPTVNSIVDSPPVTEIDRPTKRPQPTKTSVSLSSSSSTTTTFIISITTLPGAPSSSSSSVFACPTVTHTTRPSGCDPIRCPVPDCTFEKDLFVPCGCAGIKTALFVDGCQTACPSGCITKLNTVSAVCATATPTAA